MIRGRPKLPLLIFPILLLSLPPFGQPLELGTVVKVIDGDTLKIEFQGKEEKIRLIGIDSPECRENPKAEKEAKRTGQDIKKIIKMGQRATAFMQSLVKRGDKVGIEFDVEKRDQYGRLLGYVYLADGRMLNEEIVKAGYASPLTYPPNVKYQEWFLEAYRVARENKRGLWKD
jgi:micrococcal nuclease